MYEYLLTFWGSLQDTGTIEREFGSSECNYWFASAAERARMEARLYALAAETKSKVVVAKYEGTSTRLRTIAKIVFVYNGVEYKIEQDFGFGYPPESALYMFEEGNFSCDCNRSIFIGEQNPHFPSGELECGDEITMKYIDVVLL
jgi:hypothetical protein